MKDTDGQYAIYVWEKRCKRAGQIAGDSNSPPAGAKGDLWPFRGGRGRILALARVGAALPPCRWHRFARKCANAVIKYLN